MQIPRGRNRTKVDIAVTVTTVLDSLDGTIVDLSEGGAQIAGCTLPTRSQCQIDVDGYSVFGTVQWSEPDRMGIRFPYELSDGPLFDLLEVARARIAPAALSARPDAPRAAAAPPRGFGRRIG
ncbi:MAG TPA: PilZ domain-containing protein [Sphingobium sp.]|nr:PilZ domain-containing protein [Sphingobium sp.]